MALFEVGDYTQGKLKICTILNVEFFKSKLPLKSLKTDFQELYPTCRRAKVRGSEFGSHRHTVIAFPLPFESLGMSDRTGLSV